MSKAAPIEDRILQSLLNEVVRFKGEWSVINNPGDDDDDDDDDVDSDDDNDAEDGEEFWLKLLLSFE